MATSGATDAETLEPSLAVGASQRPAPTGPYTRSVAWLAARPMRSAWLLIGLFFLQVAWAHAVLWASGRVAVGAFDANAPVLSVYGPYTLGATALGLRMVQRAVVVFWPATGWPEARQAEWQGRFEAGSARIEWLALAIGAVGALLSAAAAPASALGPSPDRLPALVAYGPMFLFGYAVAAPAIVVSIGWLRTVVQLHADATAIDPFDRAPLYAFSRVTAVLGVSVVALAYYSFTANGAFQAGNLPSLVFLAVTTLSGLVAFVAPQWGIHNRLVREKNRLSQEVERRVTRLAAELYARVDAGDFAATSALNATLSGLTTLRDRVARLPTWPWPPQLLRGFVTALLLPVVVYLLTRAASSVFGT
jgi:hypothetical protein